MNRNEIQEWVKQWLGDQLGISPDEIEKDRSFASYGLGEELMQLLGEEIEDYFEDRIDDRNLTPRGNVAHLTKALCALCDTDDEDLSSLGSDRDYEMDQTLREIGFGGLA